MTTAAAVVLAVSAGAGTASDRPTGFVEDCSTQQGLGGGSRWFTSRWSVVVGPLALKNVREYAASVRGNKILVYVWGGHRVTLEFSPETRRGAGFAFGRADNGLRDADRVVTFIACRRGEKPQGSGTTAWPVSSWVGWLFARSPRCLALDVWVDDEPAPRRTIIPFGVSDCG